MSWQISASVSYTHLVASVAVSEARTLTITPWDRTLLRAISKAILASDVGINPIDCLLYTSRCV